MKLCKDCKYVGGSGNNVCIRPVPYKGIDYVNGLTTMSLCRFCNDERNDTVNPVTKQLKDSCGPDATFFESKIQADDTHQADVPSSGRIDSRLMDIAHNPDPRD
jgi:hypothetical protein